MSEEEDEQRIKNMWERKKKQKQIKMRLKGHDRNKMGTLFQILVEGK